MSLDLVLLGTLREPASGYDLKQRFETVFRHFWPAELSQIYRTLRRLEGDGLLTSRAEASDKGPDKRVYHTTPRGRARLRQWLAAGPEVKDDRHAFVAQVFFLDELRDAAATRAFLTALRDEFRARLAALQAAEASWRASDPAFPDDLSDHDFHGHLTLSLGLAKYAAIADWADQQLARVEARLARGAHRDAHAV